MRMKINIFIITLMISNLQIFLKRMWCYTVICTRPNYRKKFLLNFFGELGGEMLPIMILQHTNHEQARKRRRTVAMTGDRDAVLHRLVVVGALIADSPELFRSERFSVLDVCKWTTTDIQ